MRKVMRNAARRLARTSLLLLCLGLTTQAYAAGPDYDGLNKQGSHVRRHKDAFA